MCNWVRGSVRGCLVKPNEQRQAVENEVNATIKLVMVTMEEMASLPPELASDPAYFNERRIGLIRKVWNLAKECMRYGASTVQP